jgi:hypothetical protein
MNIVRVSKSQYELMGSASLVAYVTMDYPPSPVTIQFEQTSIEWRKDHNGPEEIIVPEYLPTCLCDDILTLIRLGYTLTIGEYSP